MDKPDWKNTDNYRYLEGEESREVWAWEFLRRLPAYQKAWLDFLKKSDQMPNYVGYEPEMNESETETEWRKRCSDMGVGGRKLTLGRQQGERWHLYEMADPSFRYGTKANFLHVPKIPRLIRFPEQINQFCEYRVPNDPDMMFIQSDYCVIAFDLRASWNSQLNTAKELFENLRKNADIQAYEKKHTNQDGQKWTRYIRVLDAVAAGASPKEIGEELKEKHISMSAIDAGHEFVDLATKAAENYRKVLFAFVPNSEKSL